MCATSSVLPLMKDHEDESQRGMDSFVSGYKAPTFPRQISDFAAAEQQNDEPSGNRGMATVLFFFFLIRVFVQQVVVVLTQHRGRERERAGCASEFDGFVKATVRSNLGVLEGVDHSFGQHLFVLKHILDAAGRSTRNVLAE